MSERKNSFAAFLRENWLFLVAPVLLALALLLLLVLVSDGSPSQFIYNLW